MDRSDDRLESILFPPTLRVDRVSLENVGLSAVAGVLSAGALVSAGAVAWLAIFNAPWVGTWSSVTSLLWLGLVAIWLLSIVGLFAWIWIQRHRVHKAHRSEQWRFRYFCLGPEESGWRSERAENRTSARWRVAP